MLCTLEVKFVTLFSVTSYVYNVVLYGHRDMAFVLVSSFSCDYGSSKFVFDLSSCSEDVSAGFWCQMIIHLAIRQ